MLKKYVTGAVVCVGWGCHSSYMLLWSCMCDVLTHMLLLCGVCSMLVMCVERDGAVIKNKFDPSSTLVVCVGWGSVTVFAATMMNKWCVNMCMSVGWCVCVVGEVWWWYQSNWRSWISDLIHTCCLLSPCHTTVKMTKSCICEC